MGGTPMLLSFSDPVSQWGHLPCTRENDESEQQNGYIPGAGTGPTDRQVLYDGAPWPSAGWMRQGYSGGAGRAGGWQLPRKHKGMELRGSVRIDSRSRKRPAQVRAKHHKLPRHALSRTLPRRATLGCCDLAACADRLAEIRQSVRAPVKPLRMDMPVPTFPA